jgi:hypothetical protein
MLQSTSLLDEGRWVFTGVAPIWAALNFTAPQTDHIHSRAWHRDSCAAFRVPVGHKPKAVNILHSNHKAEGMRQLRSTKMENIAGWSALIAAFTICLSIVLLSWPITDDTKYAGRPQGTGSIGTGKVILVSDTSDAP